MKKVIEPKELLKTLKTPVQGFKNVEDVKTFNKENNNDGIVGMTGKKVK